jgi:Arc/MetJ-type ribon-helix-helix transcriptional regulator
MQVTLPPQLEARIQREIDRGAFDTPVEVIETALDQLEAAEREASQLCEMLSVKLDKSFAAAEDGEFVTEQDLQRTLDAWHNRLAR